MNQHQPPYSYSLVNRCQPCAIVAPTSASQNPVLSSTLVSKKTYGDDAVKKVLDQHMNQLNQMDKKISPQNMSGYTGKVGKG